MISTMETHNNFIFSYSFLLTNILKAFVYSNSPRKTTRLIRISIRVYKYWNWSEESGLGGSLTFKGSPWTRIAALETCTNLVTTFSQEHANRRKGSLGPQAVASHIICAISCCLEKKQICLEKRLAPENQKKMTGKSTISKQKCLFGF